MDGNKQAFVDMMAGILEAKGYHFTQAEDNGKTVLEYREYGTKLMYADMDLAYELVSTSSDDGALMECADSIVDAAKAAHKKYVNRILDKMERLAEEDDEDCIRDEMRKLGIELSVEMHDGKPCFVYDGKNCGKIYVATKPLIEKYRETGDMESVAIETIKAILTAGSTADEWPSV